MNDFIQLKEYLDNQLKENCEDLDKFVLEFFYRFKELSLTYIEDYNEHAREKVKRGFERDCDIFKKSNKHFSKFISDIYKRGLEKIDTFAEHKVILLRIKYEPHEGEIDKKTLLKWLTGNEV